MNSIVGRAGYRRTGLILLLGGLTASLAGAQAPVGSGPVGPLRSRMAGPGGAPAAAPIDYVAPRPQNFVLSRSMFGTLTVGDLQEYAKTGLLQVLGQVDPTRVPELPEALLRQAAEAVTVRQLARAEAAKTTDSEALKHAQMADDNIVMKEIVRKLVQDEIEAKVTTVTEQQAKTFYDQHHAEFKQPFQFKMRHLILLTYKPHVVSEGETLESIAAEAGVTSDSIRADMAGRPPRYQPDAMFRPLDPGEKLLVPMSKSEVALKRNELETILKQHDEKSSETSFAALAKRYSENELKGQETEWLPSGTRPMVGELLKAAQDTPVGGISGVFQTKHGVQVIQVTDKKLEGFKPFDEIKQQIIQQLGQQQREKLSNALLEKLAAQPGFKVDIDKFAHSDKLTTATVVATVGKTQIHWQEVSRQWEQYGRNPTEAGIKEAIRVSREVQMPLVRLWGEPLLADAGSPFAKRVERLRDLIIGGDYLDRLTALDLARGVTPERIQRYYQEHPEEFKAPERMTFVSLKRVTPPAAANEDEATKQARTQRMLADLKSDLENVTSADAFKSIAAQINDALSSQEQQPPQAPKPLATEQVAEPWRGELIKLQPGKWSAPFALNDGVGAVLLTERLPAGLLPLNEVGDQVRGRVFQQINATTTSPLPTELLKRAQFAWINAPGAGS